MRGENVPRPIDRELLDSLPTPCLVIDAAAARRNIERAAMIARTARMAIRPHFKAHKMTTLMREQVDAGASGVTCQTGREALVLARAGFRDILVANEIVDPESIAELTQAADLATVSVAVDQPEQIDLLAARMGSRPSSLGVVVELDVGGHRCGVEPTSPELLALVDRVGQVPGLAFAGLLAYEGHLSLLPGRRARRTGLRQVVRLISLAREALARAGFTADIITGGGTGTLDLLGAAGAHTEAQPGSYVLMDATYSRLRVPFEPALFAVARVLSLRRGERAVLDAGLKSLSMEYGLPRSMRRGLTIVGLADEHARARLGATTRLELGEPILIQPSHIDPTVNLHPRVFVADEGTIHTWAVDGRRS